ncbi:unnamed protein product [Sphagnum balticum]
MFSAESENITIRLARNMYAWFQCCNIDIAVLQLAGSHASTLRILARNVHVTDRKAKVVNSVVKQHASNSEYIRASALEHSNSLACCWVIMSTSIFVFLCTTNYQTLLLSTAVHRP